MNWTCEGLKQWLCDTFFSLPPGVNWTCEGLKREQNKYIYWHSNGVNWTCEGLKRTTMEVKEILLSRVNWTCEGLKLLCLAMELTHLKLVWIEPVRDWNSKNNSSFANLNKCVNWTCEGLKQPKRELGDWVFRSVNWTCEGLKRVEFSSVRKRLSCVWIEPVRDWNG